MYKGASNTCEAPESQRNCIAQQQSTIPLLGFIQAQSKQLLQYLANLITNSEVKQNSLEATDLAAYMAGIKHALNVVQCLCDLNQGISIMDSGASEHMSSERSALHDLSLLQKCVLIDLPNDAQVKVTHQGKLKIA